MLPGWISAFKFCSKNISEAARLKGGVPGSTTRSCAGVLATSIIESTATSRPAPLGLIGMRPYKMLIICYGHRHTPLYRNVEFATKILTCFLHLTFIRFCACRLRATCTQCETDTCRIPQLGRNSYVARPLRRQIFLGEFHNTNLLAIVVERDVSKRH